MQGIGRELHDGMQAKGKRVDMGVLWQVHSRDTQCAGTQRIPCYMRFRPRTSPRPRVKKDAGDSPKNKYRVEKYMQQVEGKEQKEANIKAVANT